MKHENLMDDINYLKARIEALEQDVKDLEATEEAGPWAPKVGDHYFFPAASGEVQITFWDGGRVDKMREAMGNVYRTQAEAEHAVKVKKAWAKYRRMPGVKKFVFDENNWCVVEDRTVGYGTANWRGARYLGVVYFDTRENAEAAIEAMGEDMALLFDGGV